MRILFLSVLAISLSILSACGGSSSTPKSAPVLTGVAVTPAGPSVNIGATQQFTATATYNDGSTANVTSSATWSSSDATQATVQTTGQPNPGLATGVATGAPTVTATFSGANGNATLTINSATLKSLAITPTNPTIALPGTQAFVATGTYSDGSTAVVTNSATWASSDITVATIQTAGQSSAGLATAVANGSTNIQATVGKTTALTILNVSTTGTQTGLNLSEIDPSIAPGSTLNFIAEAVFNNNSKQDVTTLPACTWTSSDSSKVTVSAGLVTGVAVTTTPVTITASYGGFSNTATVTVATNAKPIALMDMKSSDSYLGFAGGLYENSSDTVPPDHDAAGVAAAAAIHPLNQSGNQVSNGAVVFLGIGMSNATIEFSAFKTAALANSSVNRTTLAMEDGAYGSVTACEWTVAQGPTTAACPNASGVPAENQYDRVRDTVLAIDTSAPSAPSGCGTTTNPCLTEAQVQVIWLKDANPAPADNGLGSLTSSTVCANDLTANPVPEACNYELQLGKILRAARSRYPNLKQVFLSTRIYAGYASVPLNPEPYAYEYGFSAKWVIEAQILQNRNGTADFVAGNLNYDSSKGTVVAPWTAWGTYLWADGDIPRSDSLVWLPSDFQSDGTHPNPQGTQKVVNLLMNFFLSSKYTSSWF
jgi:uncharacterized protein YjdB/lysophospholipase L1-like esterase